MQGYIYLIENKINGKKYIGQTTRTIEERWKEHCKDSLKKRLEKRPLYNAINKYGSENFILCLVEEVEESLLSEREIYWINYYNTYKEGYNATLGGEGCSFIDKQSVIDNYKKLQNQNEVSKLLKYHPSTIRKILKINDIDIKNPEKVLQEKLGNKISAYSLDGKFIKSFPSQISAGKWVLELGKTKITDLTKLSYTIGRAARHLDNRKQAYGFKWEFE